MKIQWGGAREINHYFWALLRDFIQCANKQVLITWSTTASVHKFGGCGYMYDDDIVEHIACMQVAE